MGIYQLVIASPQDHAAKSVTDSVGRTDSCSAFAGPAQNCLDAGQKLTRRERLRHVIVSPDLKAKDAVHFLGLGGQQDEGNFRSGMYEAGKRQTVFARHHDIQQYEVDAAYGDDRSGLSGVSCLSYAKTVLSKIARQRVADVALVIDQEDVRFASHQ